MESWLLVCIGSVIGFVLVAGALWWALAAERRPNRWLPSQKDQMDNSSGCWWGDSGGPHGGGDLGGGHH